MSSGASSPRCRPPPQRIRPDASVAEAIDVLEHEGAAIEGEDAFRQWMQDTQDATIESMHGLHFEIAEPIRNIEAMIAPPGGALAMYYTGPSEDFARPGRTWYPTGGATRFPLWRELSVCYHEGVPGHHLQIGTTRYLGDALNRYQRLLAGTSGYVEGWALYAERLMHELGYLEDPGYYMGLLSSQALRAARVVVDIGMHLELDIPDAGAVSRRRDLAPRARPRLPARALILPRPDARQRGRPLPRLARPGDQLQGRRARVARRKSLSPRSRRPRLRPQKVPPANPRARPHGPPATPPAKPPRSPNQTPQSRR